MPKNLKCAQCGSMNEALNEDPRVPPIDEYDCLCDTCLELANAENSEETEG